MTTAAAKNKGGRPAHQPTDKDRQTVEALVGVAIPQAKIASIIGIDIKTLGKHYASEIARGSAMVEAKLVGNLLRLASGNDGTAFRAIEFALCCRFGWSKYAPAPVEPKAPQLGKKESARLDAQTAHETTDWGHLLN